MTVKTDVSRFHIHDELTAPAGSVPILRTILSKTTALSNFLGVLATAPSALRAFTRQLVELRSGALSAQTRARIALAVAERRGDEYSLHAHVRLARAAGLGLDEIRAARNFESEDPREQALLSHLEAVIESHGPSPIHLVEEAREAGWSDEEILEAVSQLAAAEFQSLIANSAGLPLDDSVKRDVLPAAA